MYRTLSGGKQTRQVMGGQLRPDSPVSSQPITHECLGPGASLFAALVFSGATSKEPSGELGEGKGKERKTEDGGGG